LDAEDVVVNREHVHVGNTVSSWRGDRDLGVVDAGEVASTSWLVFFWLERKGVAVHTWVWVTRVVVVRLDLVEVLTLLSLEAILTVEDELEFGHWTSFIFGEDTGGTIFTTLDKWNTSREGSWDIAVTRKLVESVGFELDGITRWVEGEVPQLRRNVGRGGGGVVEAPDKFLNWVVEGEALVGGLTRGDGVNTGVLDLLDEVFVTLLRKSAAFFDVKVDVVGPHLELVGVTVLVELVGQIEVDADFVVLERNQWQIQTWVAVEEEDEWQVNSVTINSSGHLTPRSLLGFIQVKLGVQTPPALVVLVDALTTNGEFGGRDRTFGNPVAIEVGRVVVVRGRRLSRVRFEFDVHVADQITVAGNGNGNTTRCGWGTVDSLFDVFHREVSVTLVDRLEEGHLRVSSQVDVLGAVSYELHETTGHCESFCTIDQHFFSG